MSELEHNDWEEQAAKEIVELFCHNPPPPIEAVAIVEAIINKHFECQFRVHDPHCLPQ